MDLEHFMESFLARLSNQVPSLCPPVARLANVFDFCRVLISMVGTRGSMRCRPGFTLTVFYLCDVVTVPG